MVGIGKLQDANEVYHRLLMILLFVKDGRKVIHSSTGLCNDVCHGTEVNVERYQDLIIADEVLKPVIDLHALTTELHRNFREERATHLLDNRRIRRTIKLEYVRAAVGQ